MLIVGFFLFSSYVIPVQANTIYNQQSLIDMGYSIEEVQKIVKRSAKIEGDIEDALQVHPGDIVNNSSTYLSEVKENSITSQQSIFSVNSVDGTPQTDTKATVLQKLNLSNHYNPYNLSTEMDTISPIDGGLQFRKLDMSLIGRNGLDFDLIRQYSSIDSQIFEMDTGHTVYPYYGHFINLDAQKETESLRYLSRTNVMKKVTLKSCISNQVISIRNIVGEKELKGPYSTYNQAMDSWREGELIGTGPVFGSTCKDTNNKTYADYESYAEGPFDVFSEPSLSVFSLSNETRSFTLGPYLTEEEAIREKDSINVGDYEGNVLFSEGLTGSNSKGFIITRWKIGSTPSATHSREVVDHYNYYFNKTRPNKDQSRFSLGLGWKWDIPYIETVDGKYFMNLPEVGTYEIHNNILKNYPWKDLQLSNSTAVTVQNRTSTRKLLNSDQTAYYFDNLGYLIQIADSYNNTINFEYIIDGTKHLLSKIRASNGNQITITYQSDVIKISQGDKVVTLKKSMLSDGQTEYLQKVTDEAGGVTTFSYEKKEAKFNLLNTTPTMSNPYLLLTEVMHPTGLKATYMYETQPSKNFIGNDAVNEMFRLTQNSTSALHENGEEIENSYTKFSYSAPLTSYTANQQIETIVTTLTNQKKMVFEREYDTTRAQPYYYLVKEEKTSDAASSMNVKTYTYDKALRHMNPIRTAEHYVNKASNQLSAKYETVSVFNEYGKLKTYTDEKGFVTDYSYDPTTQLLLAENQALNSTKSRYTAYTRNAKGKVTKIQVFSGGPGSAVLKETTYPQIDIYGNVLREETVQGGRKYIQDNVYSSAGLSTYLTGTKSYVKDLAGAEHTIENSATYDPSTGNMISFTDGKGNQTSYSYDKLNRLLTVKHPDSSQIEYKYDDVQNTETIRDEEGKETYRKWDASNRLIEEGVVHNGVFQQHKKISYNTDHQIISETDAMETTISFLYDYEGRVLEERVEDAAGEQLALKLTSYDDVTNTMTQLDELENKVETVLDIFDRPLSVNKHYSDQLRNEQLTYDANGNVLTHIDGKGYQTLYHYDVLGNLDTVTMPNGEVTRYQHDYFGNVIRTIYADSSSVTNWYDEGNRLLKKTDLNGLETLYQYDKNNNLILLKDRNGVNQQFTYDVKDQLVNKEGTTATGDKVTVTFRYYKNGLRSGMQDTTGSTTYTYDGMNRLQQVTFSDSKTLSYSYDLNSNKTQVQSPFGKTIDFSYDPLNRLTAIDEGNIVSYSYLPNQLLGSKLFGNDTETVYDYDFDHQIGVTHNRGSEASRTESYSYDLNHNIQRIQRDERDDVYTYDALDRMAQKGTQQEGLETYSYDLKGNIQTRQQPSLADIVDLSYEYDGFGKLIRVTTDQGDIRYSYNGDGVLVERIGSDGTQTKFYHDGDFVLAERTVKSDNSQTVRYHYNGIEREAVEDEELHFFITDGLNNTVEVQSVYQDVLSEYRYDEWGNTTIVSEGYQNEYLYNGEYVDPDTGLQYLRARWYDSKTQRFITEDSYLGESDNPLSLHLYTYVENNPLIYNDPSGERKGPSNPVRAVESAGSGFKSHAGSAGSGKPYFDAIKFEREFVRLPPTEKVGVARAKGAEIAKQAGFVKDDKLSKINGRDVYVDKNTGKLYSIDKRHGRFEVTDKRGKHLGEVRFDFTPSKKADKSGKHDLKVK